MSNKGLDIAVHDYEAHVVRTAWPLHARMLCSRNVARTVWALARYNLNFDQLSAPGAGGRTPGGIGAGLPQSLPEHPGAQRGNPLCVR